MTRLTSRVQVCTLTFLTLTPTFAWGQATRVAEVEACYLANRLSPSKFIVCAADHWQASIVSLTRAHEKELRESRLDSTASRDEAVNRALEQGRKECTSAADEAVNRALEQGRIECTSAADEAVNRALEQGRIECTSATDEAVKQALAQEQSIIAYVAERRRNAVRAFRVELEKGWKVEGLSPKVNADGTKGLIYVSWGQQFFVIDLSFTEGIGLLDVGDSRYVLFTARKNKNWNFVNFKNGEAEFTSSRRILISKSNSQELVAAASEAVAAFDSE